MCDKMTNSNKQKYNHVEYGYKFKHPDGGFFYIEAKDPSGEKEDIKMVRKANLVKNNRKIFGVKAELCGEDD